MDWVQLLSNKRFGDKGYNPHDETRSRFEQDFDRIIFSHPFRKLQDKTQVFPLPEDDFVHTRLTHSLEVSSVGRSLGKNAGSYLLNKYPILKDKGYQMHDIGVIVAAACLAHDLGNPPFGHSGENSISSFFFTNEKGRFFKDEVSEKEWKDLVSFEGNAQGFRILNKDKKNGGLNLTFATLGTFIKYPISSSCQKDEKRKSQKKYGYFQSNSALFEILAKEIGLHPLSNGIWARHPLAFLVEAADDICYNIIDLEDGCRLGLVSLEQVKALLSGIIGENYSEEKLEKIPSLNEKLGILRSMTINKLIEECSQLFQEKEEEMLCGSFDNDLASLIPSAPILKTIKALSVEEIYRSKPVLEKEVGGVEVIYQLISSFSIAIYYTHCINQPQPKHYSILRLIPEAYSVQLNNTKSNYEALQIIIDFISGLTDSHAVRLYQIISGNRLVH